ncbi:hypothetical protein G5C51_24485 [Streptomyces sp. A7024]|uniref:Lipoprotein n=1 Tax=Streptomyces coryli TaxID=1128680 RepID=A0A6G4U4W8_9ACTN|nr:hypothetical protein [Streptomyces coryli]NGN67052.1 hypothetical protein [Streptomyces coryli]
MKSRPSHRRALLPVALLACAALAAGCKGGESDGAKEESATPKGWKSLKGPTVSLAYPPAWKAQSKEERAEGNDAFAYNRKNGLYVSSVSIQSDFAKVSDADEAAGVVRAGAMTSTTVKDGIKKVKVQGAEARRTDLYYTSSGKNQTAPKGSRMNGVIIAGVDSKKKIFSVRIDAQQGTLSTPDLNKIIKSIKVK